METIPITLAGFDIDAAIRSVTIKLVGYAEAVRFLCGRFRPGASVVLFGGLAKDRPYQGSTMVTTFNAGLTGLVRTLAAEIAPYRVNGIHPAVQRLREEGAAVASAIATGERLLIQAYRIDRPPST